MTNFIGRRPIIDYQSAAAANVAGIWSLDDIAFMRAYNYVTDSSRNTIIEQFLASAQWTCVSPARSFAALAPQRHRT